MNIVGFEKTAKGEVKEYFPNNTQLSTNKEKRAMFMHMFNTYVDKELRFTQVEMSNGKNLYEIFKNKIEKMLFCSSILSSKPPSKIVKIERIYSYSVNVFIQKESISKPINPNVSLKYVSKLIDMVYNYNKCRLFCDVNDMFLHLVYERVKPVNKGKKILLYDKSIVILDKSKDVSPTLLIPSYTQIDKTNLYHEPIVQHHMKTVLNTLKETQIRQIYLIYPKHPGFKKHITLKLLDKIPVNEDEYRVKVIPYSFSFCTKKQFTRRQKCQ